jgi:PKD repeat protein
MINKLSLFLLFIFLISAKINAKSITIDKHAEKVLHIIAPTITATGPTSFCYGGSVTLSTADVTDATYQWIKDGVDIAGENQKNLVVNTPGKYAINVNGEISNEIEVIIYSFPNASFSSNASGSNCSNEEISFTNTSVGIGLTYEWDFGDPNSGALNKSTEINPKHIFIGTPGNGMQSFSVILKVKNADGCEATFTSNITTKQLPDVNVADVDVFDPFSNCRNNPTQANPNYSITIKNTSLSQAIITSYTIDWKDGSIQNGLTNSSFPVTHQYTQLGAFDITVTGFTSNGCSVTKVYTIANQSNPAGSLGTNGGTNGVCAPAGIPFTIPADKWTLNSPGTIYTLDYGDGTKDVFQHPLNNTNEDFVKTHIYLKTSCPGSFTATLTVKNACDETPFTAGNIKIWTSPVADFITNPTSTCVGKSVSFLNKTLLGSSGSACSSITTYIWDFGDPSSSSNSSTLENPNHVYSNPGSYEVTLISTNGCGSTTKKKIICINPLPKAKFTVDGYSGCAPFIVKTTNISLPPTCDANTYTWNVTYANLPGCTGGVSNYTLLNNTSLTSENPQFQFNTAGIYTISLVAKNSDGGCISSMVTEDIIVKQKPTVSISAIASICEGDSFTPVALINTCGSNTTPTYVWSFPGSTTPTSSIQNPTGIVYPTAGIYDVTLKVSNECGSTTSLVQKITVNAKPVIDAVTDKVFCRGASSGIISFSSSPAVAGVTYNWSNSNTAIGLATSGTGNILNFTANNATSNIITADITVIPKLGNCNGTPITFKISVNPSAPTANAGPDQNLCNVFSATLSGNDPGLNFIGQWTQTSGPTAGVSFNDAYKYNATVDGLSPGETYNFKWTINGLGSCPSTNDDVVINISPKTIGGTTDGGNVVCAGPTSGSISLTGQVGSVIRWESSTNGTTWTNINSTATVHNYVNISTTTHFRALVKSGNCNQEYSTISIIQVNPIPTKPNGVATIIYCLNDVANVLSATGTDLKWYPTAIIGGNDFSTIAPTPSTSVASVLKYYVTQTVNGCESLPLTITVNVNLPIANNTINNDQTICKNTAPNTITAAVLSGGDGNYVYQWYSSADGVTWSIISGATLPNFSPGTLSVDTYYKREVKSGNCNSTSNFIKITVLSTLTNTNISSNQTICNGAVPDKLIGEVPAGGSGTFTYTWEKSTSSATTGFTIITGENGVDYQPLALTQTTYYRRNTNGGSCSASSSVVTVTVNPIPVIQPVVDAVVCNSLLVSTTIFQSTVSSPNITYAWTNDNTSIGLAATGSGNISTFTATNALKIPIEANINVVPTYNFGGRACDGLSTNFKFIILPNITTAPINDINVCAGTVVPLTVLNSDAGVFTGSNVSYNWIVTGGTIGLVDGNGTQIPTFTALNNTALPITATVTVIPNYEYMGKKCSGTAVVYKITVNPRPIVNFSIANQTICSTSSTSAVVLNSSSPGVSFNWTATPVSGITGLVNSGTDIIPIQTLINTTNAPITIIYDAIATTLGASTCPGSSFQYKVTVNPRPTVVASDLNKIICSNTKTAISLSSPVAGTSFNWTVSNNSNLTGAFSGSGNLIDQQLVNTSVVEQTIIYTITPQFTATSVNCSGDPIIVTVKVSPSPKVNFSVIDNAICSAAVSPAVLLTSTTLGANITWSADVPSGISGVSFLNGTTTIPSETLINNTNVPLTVIYTAKASTNDLISCVGNDFIYKLTVNPIPAITNTPLNQEVCSGSNSSLVVLTSNVSGTTYKWIASTTSVDITGFVSSGTGNILPQTIFNSGTSAGIVKYIITPTANNCTGLPSTYEITVNPKPVFTSNGNPSAICSNSVFSYIPSSSTPGVTFKWTRVAVAGISNPASSGQGIDGLGAINETLINVTINPIVVTYIYELSIGGCTSTVNYPVEVVVNPAPTALFGPFSQNGCAPFAINVKNLNSKTFANIYTVDFGDGTPIEVYTDESDIKHIYENETAIAKTFKLNIKTKNDCGEVASIEYIIVVQPQSVFSKLVLQGNQRYGCAPFNIDFTNLNQSTGANVYTWDFGDGSPIQQTRQLNEPISHTYLVAGDYTVTLTATNGCSTVSTQQIVTVYPNINASFTVSQPQYCLSETVVFTNTSDQQYTSHWDFGDGTTSTDTSPTHDYATPGNKTVVLTATKSYPDGSSCSTSFTQVVVIVPGPIASFNSNAAILNCGPFKLEVTSTPANAANVEWNFGDPTSVDNIATGYNATHIYTLPGTYLVTAKAYSLQGCTATSTQTIKVTETPKPEFSYPSNLICGPNATILFKNETTYSGADVVKYNWYINDVLTSTAKDFTHTFNTPTSVLLPFIYKIKLEVINILNCSNIIEHSVQFNPLPQANFTLTVNKACAPFKPQIVNTSLFADKFEWYVDGILVSTDKDPQNIIFNDPDKVHDIKLIADNQYGCGSSNIIKQATTHPNPTASFTVKQDISCNGVLEVEISNTSIGATIFTWDFGDGSSVYVGNNPKHIYGKAGIYDLKLTASNGFCTDVFSQSIKVADAPKAGFLTDVKSGCNQVTVTFQNLSLNASQYFWDFGDGSFSTDKNPVHTYNYVKSPFTVKLKAIGDFGCFDEQIMVNYIAVFAPPSANIEISPSRTVKVPDYGFTFKSNTEEDIVAYKWDFGDGKTSDKQTIKHEYSDVGTYPIKLTITNSSGCISIIDDQVNVVGLPGYFYLPNAFEPAHAKPDMKVFKVTAIGMSSYTLRIFNKWGQLIWQSSKLDEEGAPTEFWNGIMNGQPAPQGAYYWSADAKFINGTEWKGMKYEGKTPSKTGVVHLIR